MRKVIVPRLGRWNHHVSGRFIYERIWWRDYIWTPFCWMERRKRMEPPEPAEITLDVAVTGYEEFMRQLQEMEKAMEFFGMACERAGEKADGVFDKLEITYNYHIINKAE